VYEVPQQRGVAERVARLVGGRATSSSSVLGRHDVNVLLLLSLSLSKQPTFLAVGSRAGGPVAFTFAGDAKLLLAKVPFGRFRYEVRP
jgi:hypothetical protein